MKLDILICGAPTAVFYSQVAFARLCLDHLGGIYRDARILLTLNKADARLGLTEIPAAWQPYLDRVDVVWAEPGSLPFFPEAAHHYLRYDLIRPEADVAIVMDADTCCIAPFDDLLTAVAAERFVGGVMAHYHFPLDGARSEDVTGDWDRVSGAALGRVLPKEEQYLFGTLPKPIAELDLESRPATPFAPNYGFLIGVPEDIRRIGQREKELQKVLQPLCGSHWGPQIGLALAIADLGLKTRALSPRYNLPNRKETRFLYPAEMKKAVVCHYMENVQVDRGRFLTEAAEFQRFLEVRFKGVDARLQDHMRKITGGRFPFRGVYA